MGSLNDTTTFDLLPKPEDIRLDIPKLTMDIPTISEDDITNSIEQLRLHHIQWTETKDCSQFGNKVIIDLRGEIDGKAFEDAHADDMAIELGIDIMMPGFQEQLIGLVEGDKKVFDLAYPNDYEDADLAGKLATFYITVKKVYLAILPTVDEQLIKTCGVPSGKLDDLIKKIEFNLLRHKTIAARQQLKEKVFNALLAINDFAVPEKLLEEERHRVHHQAEDLRVDPERTVRLSLLVASLIKKFALTPDALRVEKQIDNVVSLYKNADKMRRSIYENEEQLATIHMLALEDQLIDKLT